MTDNDIEIAEDKKMASADNLLFTEADGSLGFGDHTLAQKAKVEDYPYQGDLLKVKTYQTMTKLEKNGMFVYESVPGTTVSNFVEEALVLLLR